MLMFLSLALAVDVDSDGWEDEASGGYDCDDTDPAVLPWHCGTGDLVVDGATRTLSGNQRYDRVWVVNGGVLRVRPYNGSAGTGYLRLVADVVYVDPTSRIDADGAGYRGGAGGGAGEGGGGGGFDTTGATTLGGGGGHGGRGERGRNMCYVYGGAGGLSYGSARDRRLDLGSGGGGGATARGGAGGGGIGIVAAHVMIEGTLTARGGGGTAVDDHDISGSGSGGEIIVDADELACSGTVQADGAASVGDGAYFENGGAGGGGRVQLYAPTRETSACTVTVAAGASMCTYSLPGSGTSYVGG